MKNKFLMIFILISVIFFVSGLKSSFAMQDVNFLLNSSGAWNKTINGVNIMGQGQTICLIDTGVNFSVSGLIGKNATDCQIDCWAKECIRNCSIVDDHGHGTSIAGVMVGNMSWTGVSPSAKIVSVKFINSSGDMNGNNFSDYINAINWCVQNSTDLNISAISASVGDFSAYSSYCDDSIPLMTTAINNAILNNVTFVGTNGNNNVVGKIWQPACVKNATSVAYVNKSLDGFGLSNRNNLTNFLGIGLNINTTNITGNSGTYSGTSYATPQVASAMVLLQQGYYLKYGQKATPLMLRNSLVLTGKNISTYGFNIPLINIGTALDFILNYSYNMALYNQSSDSVSSSCDSIISGFGSFGTYFSIIALAVVLIIVFGILGLSGSVNPHMLLVGVLGITIGAIALVLGIQLENYFCDIA